MTTLFFILVVIAFLIWVGRWLRRREVEKFRDLDSKMIRELREQNDLPNALAEPTAELVTAPAASELSEAIPVKRHDSLSPIPGPMLKSKALSEQHIHILLLIESLVAPGYRVLVNHPLSDFAITSAAQLVSFLVVERESFAVVLVAEFQDRLYIDGPEENLKQLLSGLDLPILELKLVETETSLNQQLIALKPEVLEEGGPKKCPKCFGDMRLRTPTTGKNAGKRFWVCKSYPKCKGLIPL